MSFGFRKLGEVTMPEVPVPGALGGVGSLGLAIMEYGADVVAAKNAGRYVTELGALTPTCVRKAWSGTGWGGRHGGLRADLLERGATLRSIVEATADSAVKPEALALLDVIDGVAGALPEEPPRDSVILGYPAAWTSPDVLPIEVTVRAALGGFWSDVADWVERYGSYGDFAGYIILAPLIVGTVPTLIYFAGAAVGRGISDGFVGFLRRAVAREQATFLSQVDDAHAKWQADLRGMYRQLWTTHVIAQSVSSREDRIGALMLATPASAPAAPALWNGLLPDPSAAAAAAKPPSVWWLVGAMAAAVGVLWAVD